MKTRDDAIKSSIDIVEEAKIYFMLSKGYLETPIPIGSRKQLAKVLANMPADMIMATYGTSKQCIILVDYSLGDMMDIIAQSKRK